VSHYKSRQHASAQAGEDIINQAKAAGRSLTPSERAELERCIKEAEDARDMATLGDQVTAMREGMSSATKSGMFDQNELADFTRAAASGFTPEPLRATKATLTTATTGGFGPTTAKASSAPSASRRGCGASSPKSPPNRRWVPRSQCLGPCGNVPRRGRTARAREILSELAELSVACPEWPPVDRRALSVLPLDTTSFPPRDHEAR
jgi:hypothetical protein